MKFVNPFRKKENPEMTKAYEARTKSTQNKLAAADKIIEMMNKLHVERRMGLNDYNGPERRTA